MICDHCGNLSIKLPDLPDQCATSIVRCGKCGHARGTLAELQHLARAGTTDFEILNLVRLRLLAIDAEGWLAAGDSLRPLG